MYADTCVRADLSGQRPFTNLAMLVLSQTPFENCRPGKSRPSRNEPSLLPHVLRAIAKVSADALSSRGVRLKYLIFTTWQDLARYKTLDIFDICISWRTGYREEGG